MLFSDQSLEQLLNDGTLIIDPILDSERQIQGGKVDLRLDNIFLALRAERADAYNPLRLPTNVDRREFYETIEVGYKEGFTLHPGSFVLGQTFELIRVPKNCFARVEGRSSLARRGLLVHVTASGVDPGYIGHICLELYNLGRVPVHLSPLMRIAAITVEELDATAIRPYDDNEEKKFGSDLRTTNMLKVDGDAGDIENATTGF